MIETENMSKRHLARLVLSELKNFDPFITFRVAADQIFVKQPSGPLLPEQIELIRKHKPELLELLTIPPQIQGQCRNGHPVKWAITPYATWTCECYFPFNEVENG